MADSVRVGAGGIVSDLISWKGKSRCVKSNAASDLMLDSAAAEEEVAFPAPVVGTRIGF